MRLTAKGPFRATKFRCTLSMASSGMTVLPSLSVGVTSTDSHSMGVFAAAKMSFTDCEISGPIPSPSISVTVYFPLAFLVPLNLATFSDAGTA